MYTIKFNPLYLKLSIETQNPKKVHSNTLNPVKSTVNLHYTLRFVSYLTENTTVILLERPVDKVVWGNDSC
jgi:hypothetical protein